jgi:hypothetical protein
MFSQVDDRFVYDSKTRTVVSVAGKAFDPDQFYGVCLPTPLLLGMDGFEPLLQAIKSGKVVADPVRDAMSCKEEALMCLISQNLAAFFSLADSSGDGKLNEEELVTLVGSKMAAKMLTAGIDQDGDSLVSFDEALAFSQTLSRKRSEQTGHITQLVTSRVCSNIEIYLLGL